MNTFTNIYDTVVTDNGNILVLDHHAKPSKVVRVYNAQGEAYENQKATLQSFEYATWLNGRTEVRAADTDEAAKLVVKSITARAAAEQAELEKNEPAQYRVRLRIIMLEGADKYRDVTVTALNRFHACAVACSQFWEKTTLLATQVRAIFSEKL